MSLLLLLACGPKGPPPDPLADLREQLEAARTDAAPGFAPEVLAVVSADALDGLLAGVVSDAVPKLAKERTFQALDVAVTVTPTVEVDRAQVRALDACVSCFQVALDVHGVDHTVLTNATGTLERDVPWTATVQAGAALRLEDGVLKLVSDDAAAWEVELGVEAEGLAQLLVPAVNQGLAKMLRGLQLPPVPVARLGTDLPLRGLEIRRVGEHVGVAAALIAPSSGEVEIEVDPGAGWVVAVPEASLAGLLQAAVLEHPPEEDLALEILAVDATDSGFTVDARAHQLGKRARTVDLRVPVAVTLADGELRLEAHDAELVDARFSPVLALLKGRLLRQLEAEVRGTLPASVEQGPLGFVVEALGRDGDTLLVRGSIR